MPDCFYDTPIITVSMDMPMAADDREMETTSIIAAESNFHLNHCVFPCHVHYS